MCKILPLHFFNHITLGQINEDYTYCTRNLELLTLSVRAFYLPCEFFATKQQDNNSYQPPPFPGGLLYIYKMLLLPVKVYKGTVDLLRCNSK